MNPPDGFRHVDERADPGQLVEYLDDTRRFPVLREVDRWLAVELRLIRGSRVLDIGCGTGEDTVELAALVAPDGCAVGLDTSEVMVHVARRRAAGRGLPVEFRTGRTEALDLPDGDYDACRFERVLHHLTSPTAALSEAARVLRPGGRLAAFEPDWTSLAITGASPAVTREVLGMRSTAFESPDVGARLSHLVAEAGFGDVRHHEVHLETTSLHVAVRAFRLESDVEAAVAVGAVSSEAAIAWCETLAAADRAAAFSAQVRGHLVCGTRLAGWSTPASS